ncbi:hypothetical protein RSAG8_07344, partial [Rhizoctonia solani AG-8 WAC10335]
MSTTDYNHSGREWAPCVISNGGMQGLQEYGEGSWVS